jgi:hypothetical protein
MLNKTNMQSTTLFIGAGFSKAGGLPLTKELFDEIPTGPYSELKNMYRNVQDSWNSFHISYPKISVEEWIKSIYTNRDNLPEFIYGISWEDVQDFILARLVNLPHGKNSHYYYGVTTCVDNEVHRIFWPFILKKFDIKNIVTTNYDILIEQGLKKEYNDHREPPLCYYGGYPYLQKVRKLLDVTKRKSEEVELGHKICLFKLHGSLNWVEEPHGYKIHDDVRAVFRKSRKLGRPRFIPPLTEKEQPKWAYDIWTHAEKALKESDIWIFCGYSCPEYDFGVTELLSNASKHKTNLKVLIMDTDNINVSIRLKKILPSNSEYELLPGLPDVLNYFF